MTAPAPSANTPPQSCPACGAPAVYVFNNDNVHFDCGAQTNNITACTRAFDTAVALRARVSELEQTNKVISRQLERRADGMDDLTQMLRAQLATVQAERDAARRDAQDFRQHHGQATSIIRELSVKVNTLTATLAALRERFDFNSHLARQKDFSERTFGPGKRTIGIVDHIRKELKEIEIDPDDATEWIDVVILALDGAWRVGLSPEQIIRCLVNKQDKNEARVWPNWKTSDPNKAIEHVRHALAGEGSGEK